MQYMFNMFFEDGTVVRSSTSYLDDITDVCRKEYMALTGHFKSGVMTGADTPLSVAIELEDDDDVSLVIWTNDITGKPRTSWFYSHYMIDGDYKESIKPHNGSQYDITIACKYRDAHEHALYIDEDKLKQLMIGVT